MKPQLFNGAVVNKIPLSWKVVELEVQHTVPQAMDFTPGQFISIRVAQNTYRSYSIASDFANQNSLKLIVEVGHDGVGASYVRNLAIGDKIEYIGPSGRLNLPELLAPNLFFFATGTGLAPFISIFYKLAHSKYEGKINLFFGLRKEDELFYQDKLEYFKCALQNFDYQVWLSQPTTSYKGNVGRVTDALPNLQIADAQFFVCGNPAMVSDVYNYLEHKVQNPKQDIIVESFLRSTTNA